MTDSQNSDSQMTDSQISDSELYSKQGFGQSSGFGVRPALLIVDLQVGFTDPEIFGGGNILDAVANTQVLLSVARDCKIPIAHTKIVYADDGSDAGVFCLKNPGLLQLTEDAPMSQIVAELTPQAGELVVRKTQPSAFIHTQLAAWLINKSVDTVIVAGCTTSGCVRASVVDSMSHNFRTIVAEDAVGDRATAPHEATLFDLSQKYADLLSTEQIISHLRSS